MLIKQDAKRVVWLDCLRAILIILMVFGHAGSEYNTFIYLAHIPGFLVVSGYTSHLKSEICDYLYIKKRIVTVLVPAVLINLVYILLCWIVDNAAIISGHLAYSGEYLPLKIRLQLFFTRLQTADLGGATWFLFVLFEAEILFALLRHLCIKCKCRWLPYGLCILCGLVGYKLATSGRYLPFLVDLSLIAVFYYGVGDFIAEYDILNQIESKIMLPLCIVLTLFFGNFWFKGRLPMNWPTRQFAEPFIQLLSCFAALYLLYEAAIWISKSSFSAIFSEIGRRTYSIVILHFLVFKLVFLISYWLGIGNISLDYLRNLTPGRELSQNGGWVLISILTIAICCFISVVAERSTPTNYLINAKWKKGGRGTTNEHS